MERRKRRKFTPEYKAEVVKLVQSSGRSIEKLSSELDLTETAVRGSASGVIRRQSDRTTPPLALATLEMGSSHRLFIIDDGENPALFFGMVEGLGTTGSIEEGGTGRLGVVDW